MNFRRWVVFTFLIHALVVLVDKGGGLILYLLLAKHTAQHGESGIIASLPFILGAVANLGLATSQVYFIRRRRFSAQHCFETSMTVALVWGGFVAVMSAVVILWLLPQLHTAWVFDTWLLLPAGAAPVPRLQADWVFDPWLVLPFCAVVPVLLVSSYANSIQLATEHVKDYGAVHLVTSLAFLPAFFVFFFGFGGDVGHDVPYAVAWGRLASTALVAVLALVLVRKVVRLRAGMHAEFLREGVRFGWKANLTSTLTYLNHRIDLVVLGAIYAVPALQGRPLADARLTQVAFYSMAVTWAELVWHFPEAMRDLFFSKVAGSTHEQARELTPILSRLGLTVSLLGGGLLLLLVNPVMGGITFLARGENDVWYHDWSPSVVGALLLLTPGTVAYTVSKVLQADLAARNQLQICVNAQLLVLTVMIGCDFLWMPTHGAFGAAAASTVAYVASTVYTLVAYSRQTGTPAWRCLLVHTSDFVYIREIVSAVVAKLRRRRW